jgi:hypothetical protein
MERGARRRAGALLLVPFAFAVKHRVLSATIMNAVLRSFAPVLRPGRIYSTIALVSPTRSRKLLDCEKLRRELGGCGRKQVEHRLNWGVEKTALLDAHDIALE